MASNTPRFDAALDEILLKLTPHTRTCSETGETFEIGEKEIELCRSLRVPPPKMIWWARLRRQRTFHACFDLFRRTLKDGNSVVTMYDPESFTKILPNADWYSDQFDPLIHGRAIDPSIPFFDQWPTLSREVPRQAIIQDAKSENSEWSVYSL